jgi:hypothetical protein
MSDDHDPGSGYRLFLIDSSVHLGSGFGQKVDSFDFTFWSCSTTFHSPRQAPPLRHQTLRWLASLFFCRPSLPRISTRRGFRHLARTRHRSKAEHQASPPTCRPISVSEILQLLSLLPPVIVAALTLPEDVVLHHARSNAAPMV